MRSLSVFVVALVLPGRFVTSGAAEDAVVYAAGKEGRGRATIAGRILDYTGTELRIRTETGGDQSVPSERIVEIKTSRTAAETEGDKLYADRQYAAAAEKYQQALLDDPRPWAQRQILARQVRAHHQAEQLGRAAEAFLRLVRSDPPTQHFDAIPLVWTPQSPASASAQQAAGWLTNPKEPVAVLIGASWLLSGNQRAAAATALQRLVSAADSRVAQLADAQLWRLRFPSASAEDLQRWQAAIDRMKPELRPGPYFVLGQGFAARGQHDQAALAFLRIPIQYPADPRLAAAALLAAGRALEKGGQREEAAALYQELIKSHPATPAAAEASGRLKVERPSNESAHGEN